MKRVISLMIIMMFPLVAFHCKKEKKQEISRKGFVNFISGTVKMISDKGAESDAKVGDEVVQGMKIKTVGDKSFVDIYFGENVIKILGNTSVSVERLIKNTKTNGEETVLSIKNGSLFSRVTKKLAKSDSFNVKTPTTTAGVRGTDFLVSEKDGKSNVACLKGKLEVLNDTMPDSKPVVLEDEKECDIEAGKVPTVKDLSEENKKRIENIVSEISEMRKEIRRKMEEQREEIRKYVRDQKEKDKTILEEQREKDKGLVEDQKQRDRENIDKIKGETKDKGDEAMNKAKEKMDEAKDVDKDSVKPEIKKLDIKKHSVKPQL